MGESGVELDMAAGQAHHGAHGLEQELRVRRIASELGVADFVFTAPQFGKGNATREVAGDGLLIVGRAGAILQVKARDPARSNSDSPQRTASWLQKHVAEAARQGHGARREITRRIRSGAPIDVTPARVLDTLSTSEARQPYQMRLDHDVSNWPTVVVVDHPSAGGMDYSVETNDTFVIGLRDWYELHRRLRSSRALIEYVQRALDARLVVPLGHEVRRYSALYEADVATDDGSASWIPRLPPPDATGTVASDVFRDLLDHVWEQDGPYAWTAPEQYRQIVQFLDSVPAHVQEEVGLKIIEYRRNLAANTGPRSGGFFLDHTHYLQILFATTAEETREQHMADLGALTVARHESVCESCNPQDITTLGVGIIVDVEKGVAYSYFYTAGRIPPLPSDLRNAVHERYGRLAPREGVVVPVDTV